jgi:hypothetical protein
MIYNAILLHSTRWRHVWFAVARVFRRGDLLRHRQQTLASEEASYKNLERQTEARWRT